jgi:short-subunit dehydrogenase
MNGKFTWPGTGYYFGTKHALEAISDSLRYELRPFGVDVVLLEPGFVKTPLGKTAVGRRAVDADDPYGDYNAEVAEAATNYTTGMLGMLACTPEAVAKVVQKSLDADKPRARYRIARSAHMFMGMRKVMPDAAFDAFLRSQYPAPKGSLKNGRPA